jgi:hypothetical protein
MVSEHDEDEEDTQARGGHGEEIDREQVPDMVGEERPPGLRRLGTPLRHQAGHGALSHIDTDFRTRHEYAGRPGIVSGSGPTAQPLALRTGFWRGTGQPEGERVPEPKVWTLEPDEETTERIPRPDEETTERIPWPGTVTEEVTEKIKPVKTGQTTPSLEELPSDVTEQGEKRLIVDDTAFRNTVDQLRWVGRSPSSRHFRASAPFRVPLAPFRVPFLSPLLVLFWVRAFLYRFPYETNQVCAVTNAHRALGAARV